MVKEFKERLEKDACDTLMSGESVCGETITQNKPHVLPRLATSSRGCEALQSIVQDSAEDQTL
jgi:hypothetical protein